jgi:hypothetical protein
LRAGYSGAPAFNKTLLLMKSGKQAEAVSFWLERSLPLFAFFPPSLAHPIVSVGVPQNAGVHFYENL